MQNPVLTVDQTAEYLDIPVSKVYELVRGKNFPAIKLGKSWHTVRDKRDQGLLKRQEEKWDSKRI